MKHIYRLLFVVCLIQGCGTNVGNGLTPKAGVALSFKAYSGATRGSVSQVILCFKRLRFKASDSSTTGENIDLTLGEVTLDPLGTSLAQLAVPTGTFTRIEFDLDNHCASGKSVQVTNSLGTIATTEGMTIKFEGNFSVDGTAQSLAMGVQAIVSALAPLSNESQIKNAAEGASGDF